jgi:Fe-S-cluster containining protein
MHITYDFEAIYRAHPEVCTIGEFSGAFDAEGKPVTLDPVAIERETEVILGERAAAELREERNRRLAETDYLALADRTMSPEAIAYRQALRDLPANTPARAQPVWPDKPAGV